MINVLFSSTRQWNCGDEFILFGIRRLLADAGLSHNALLYNRHPSITPPRCYRPKLWGGWEFHPNLDNSFFLDVPGLVDYVIFAGTPEWIWGERVEALHAFIWEHKLRCAFIGVGMSGTAPINRHLQNILNERCDLFIARDQLAFDSVEGIKTRHLMVCPSLFAAPTRRPRNELTRIGIVIQSTKTKHHSIPEDTLQVLLPQFEELERRWNVQYIAHYMDDLVLARNLGKDVRYSAYAEDYFEIFDNFDLIVSTRVHGCGIAASLGIPSILIAHDKRAPAGELFLATTVRAHDDIIVSVESVDIAGVSERLIKLHDIEKDRYVALLRQSLSVL